MANNIDVKDAAGVTKTMKTTDDGFGVHTAHHIVDSSALPPDAATETTLAGVIKAEDAAHVSGDKGIMALSVRTNTATARAGTDGDYQPLITDTNGRLHVITGPSTSTIEVVGDAAHDAAVAGNPVLVGGYASSTAPSNVSANGDVARAWYLLNGAQATALTAAGALIGGDATNGLDVDVTRLPGLGANTSTTAATFAQAVNTIAAAATPEALVASQTLVESVLIQAKKGFNSANTSAVFVGFSATNDNNYLELLPGDSVTLKAPQGKKLDLNLIYIECVTAGDGVTYTSVN